MMLFSIGFIVLLDLIVAQPPPSTPTPYSAQVYVQHAVGSSYYPVGGDSPSFDAANGVAIYPREMFENATSRPIWNYLYNDCQLAAPKNYTGLVCKDVLIFNSYLCVRTSVALENIGHLQGTVGNGGEIIFKALLLAAGRFDPNSAKEVSPQISCKANERARTWLLRTFNTNSSPYSACFDTKGRPTNVIDGPVRSNRLFTDTVANFDAPKQNLAAPFGCPKPQTK